MKISKTRMDKRGRPAVRKKLDPDLNALLKYFGISSPGKMKIILENGTVSTVESVLQTIKKKKTEPRKRFA